MLFFISVAAASVTGHYHPDDIQVRSEVFGEANERLATVFEERSRSLQRYAKALNDYQEALDLLGERAPEVERARISELRRDYAKQEAALSFVANGVIEDFDTAMVASMKRAIEPFGEVQRCKARLAKGPRLPGVPVREETNPDCEGRELNDEIAAAMDADRELKARVDEILGRDWPAIAIEEAPQAAIGDDVTEWVMVRDLVAAGAKDELTLIVDRDDARREDIDAALATEGEVDVEELRTKVRRIEQQTAQARRALAEPILAKARERLAKKAKDVAIGWCANPRVLGGCVGTDATRSRVQLLMDDRKFTKSLP